MLQVRFLLVGLLLAAGFVGFLWLRGQPGLAPVRLQDPRPEEGVVTITRSASEAVERDEFRLREYTNPTPRTSPEEELPSLNNSDDWLRGRLANTALPWLAETELIRTAATVLQNAAKGTMPRQFVEFLAPQGRFTVTRAAQITASTESFARYDDFVSILTSVSPEQAASTFNLIEPLLGEALRELGGDEAGRVVTPRELAFTALGVALETPRGIESAPLVQPKVIYKYADDELENLQPLQKQLLRMGPANLAALQEWLEDFGLALSS